MNWDNQNKDPWGGKNNEPDFDDLIKKFSSILGGKKASSNGGDSGGSGFKGAKKSTPFAAQSVAEKVGLTFSYVPSSSLGLAGVSPFRILR
mgnify:CR=1 FL=1